MSVKHTTDKFVNVERYYISGLHPHIWKHPEGEMVYFDDYVDLWAENARLKAEVERLTKAEVERLRKEGEAMYPNLGPGWSHNAKEGKQP